MHTGGSVFFSFCAYSQLLVYQIQIIVIGLGTAISVFSSESGLSLSLLSSTKPPPTFCLVLWKEGLDLGVLELNRT